MAENLLYLLVAVAVWGIVLYVLWWGLRKLALGEPWDKIGIAILVIITILVVLDLAFGVLGMHGKPLLRR